MAPNWKSQALSLLCISVLMCEAKQTYKVLNSNDKTVHSDCGSLLRSGYNISGVYRLSLNNTYVHIPCEFRDGNAFAVIMRRVDSSLDFRLSWQYYESGFGHPQGNYWVGLANIYHMTRIPRTLQINMQDWAGVNRNVLYSYFRLDQRETRYRLNIHGHSGDLPDDMGYNNQMPFSTWDAPDPRGCAAAMQAGWWYNYCAHYLPTGKYYPFPHYTPSGSMYDGMFYVDWHGYDYSIKFIQWTISQ